MGRMGVGFVRGCVNALFAKRYYFSGYFLVVEKRRILNIMIDNNMIFLYKKIIKLLKIFDVV